MTEISTGSLSKSAVDLQRNITGITEHVSSIRNDYARPFSKREKERESEEEGERNRARYVDTRIIYHPLAITKRARAG